MIRLTVPIKYLLETFLVGVLVLGLGLLMAVAPGQTHGAEAPSKVAEDNDLTVIFDDGYLTIKALNRPLVTVLRQVARRAGVNILVYGEPEKMVSVEFERLSIDDALRRLVGQYNLVFLYKEVEGPTTKPGQVRLIEAQVHVGGGLAEPTMEFAAGRFVERSSLARRRSERKAEKRRKKADRARSKKLPAASEEDTAKVLEQLKTAAFDADPEVRTDAVEELGLMDDERAALDILERVLREDPDPEVRTNAISGLEDLETVPVEPILDAVLFDDAAEVRIGAIEIIEEQDWNDQRTVDTLSRVLDDSNQEIRLAALELLGELGERAALEVAARSNPHEEVRVLATELLTALQQ